MKALTGQAIRISVKGDGDEIPYLARILTVADCFDAMTFSRPYKLAMTYDEAIMELKRCSKKQLDPFVTKNFIEIIKDLNNNTNTSNNKQYE